MTNRTTGSITRLADRGGNIIDTIITNGESDAVDISSGYQPSDVAARDGFYICPLGTGTINVVLAGQNQSGSFNIPAARVTAKQGLWMEEKCIAINATGTTVTSALIGWNTYQKKD